MKTNRMVIPAAPGFFYLEMEDVDYSVSKMPIIGWAVDPDNEERAGVEPVTIEGIVPRDYGRERSGILQPDGTVVYVTVPIHFKNYEEWRDHATQSLDDDEDVLRGTDACRIPPKKRGVYAGDDNHPPKRVGGVAAPAAVKRKLKAIIRKQAAKRR